MIYVITESQSRLLMEQDWELWIRRRATPDYLSNQIEYSKQLHRNPCDWPDEYDYAQDVIDWVVTDFIAAHEELYNSDREDEYYSILVDYCKDLFAEEIFDHFRDKCEDKDMEVEVDE